MVRIIFAKLAFAFLFFVSFNVRAQDAGITSDDTQASLEISKHIIKLVSALAKDFTDVKGDLLTTTEDGTKVYSVNNMSAMKANDQYIMIKKGGAAYYVANYTGDAKQQTMAFAAFTGGVITITNADGNFEVTNDKDKSTNTKLVYVMSVKGTKVGSFTLETDKKEGTLIVGFL